MTQNLRLNHRGHHIVAALLKGKAAAQVYVGKAMATRERFEGSTVEEAAGLALAWIDARRAEVIQSRRSPRIGTADEYATYFAANPPERTRRAMLVAHASAPDLTLSAGQLAEAAGWADFSTANLHYGLLGKEVAEALELELPRHSDGSVVATAALAGSADPNWKPVDGVFRWRMYEEVAEALNKLKIR